MVLWFGVTLWLLQVGIRCHISQERWVARCYIQCITVRAPLCVHAVDYICVSVAFLNKEGPAVCIALTYAASVFTVTSVLQSQVALSGMSLGDFPVQPQTAVGMALIAYFLMDIRGLVVLSMCLGFAMIKTEHASARNSNSGNGNNNNGRIGRTIADLPQTPSQGG